MPDTARSPRRAGRPKIGGEVQVRLGDLLPDVDAWAADNGVKRAEAIRRLVLAGLRADGKLARDE